MTHTVLDVNGNKTLGVGDDGMIQLVNVAATITLPHEDTHKFVQGDDFTIISNTDDTVTVMGEEGVTIIPLPNASITQKGCSVNIKYQGGNTYLLWGLLCLILMFGAMYLADSPITQTEGDIIFTGGE